MTGSSEQRPREVNFLYKWNQAGTKNYRVDLVLLVILYCKMNASIATTNNNEICKHTSHTNTGPPYDTVDWNLTALLTI